MCSIAQLAASSQAPETTKELKMKEKVPKSIKERAELLARGLALAGIAAGSGYTMYYFLTVAYTKAISTPLQNYLKLPKEVIDTNSKAYKTAQQGEKLKWLYSFLGLLSATSIGYTNVTLEIPQKSFAYLKRAFSRSTKKTSVVK